MVLSVFLQVPFNIRPKVAKSIARISLVCFFLFLVDEPVNKAMMAEVKERSVVRQRIR